MMTCYVRSVYLWRLLLLLVSSSSSVSEATTTSGVFFRHRWRSLTANQMRAGQKNGFVYIRAGETTNREGVLPTGKVGSRVNTILWSIPFLICFLSFWSFQYTSSWFYSITRWASANTWIPQTEEEVNLQTNVVVRTFHSTMQGVPLSLSFLLTIHR